MLAACPVAGAEAPPLADWDLTGSNTLQAEYYDADGDPASSPWPHLGGQIYNEFEFSAHHRVSPWERVRVSLSALLNESEYRSNEQGGLVERATVFWEKGDAELPFRLQAGDYFANQTANTIQLGLKGLQAELQPGTGQALRLFSGLAAPVYRDLGTDQGFYNGLAWITESERIGAWQLSALRYDRSADATAPELQQNMVSLAWYQPFQLGSHALELDSELAHFSGDYDALGGLADGDENGVYVQLLGRDAPLDYRLLYERYGEHFRPSGGSTKADNRSAEAHAGWRFASGAQLRGRLQSFRDDLESANPLDTQVAGLALFGPVGAAGMSAGLDAYLQSREDEIDAVDSDTRNIALNLSLPLTARWNLRSGFQWTATEDHVAARTTIGRDVNVAFDAGLDYDGWRGSATVGVSARNNSGNAATTDFSPNLAIAMSKAGHGLRFSHSWLNQDGRTASSIDTDIHQTGLAYTYDRERHRIGLELNRYDRDPDTGEATEAYRASLYWRYTFDRPARQAPGVGPRPAVAAAASGSELPQLLDLVPSGNVDQLVGRLEAGRLTPAYRLPGLVVYEAQMLPGIALRQRLAVTTVADEVDAIVLLLDFSATDDVAQMEREYARVRDLLLREYGAPDAFTERGAFDGNIAAAQLRDGFERTLQWRTPSGVLRFGIPRRLDGLVRMEIRHATRIGSGQAWGLEAVR